MVGTSGNCVERRAAVTPKAFSQFGADHAGGTATVGDDDRLPEGFRQRGAEGACGAIDAAARRPGYDQSYWSRWIVLGVRWIYEYCLREHDAHATQHVLSNGSRTIDGHITYAT